MEAFFTKVAALEFIPPPQMFSYMGSVLFLNYRFSARYLYKTFSNKFKGHKFVGYDFIENNMLEKNI